jgi:transcriptional regulator with XRE-family HTH domain
MSTPFVRKFLAHFHAMVGIMSVRPESAFIAALCRRVRTLRTRRGWTAAQMATALGIPAERYRKYETRSPLPSYLMERFCLIVDCDLDFLLTGKSTVTTRIAHQCHDDNKNA